MDEDIEYFMVGDIRIQFEGNSLWIYQSDDIIVVEAEDLKEFLTTLTKMING